MLSKSLLTIFSLLLFTTLTTAHLAIQQPIPIGLDRVGGTEKYALPLKADGSDFPCKRLFKIGTPEGLGPVVETWPAGSVQKFTISTKGVAAHWGGSCQASISYDYGKTWQVIRSFMGGCPRGAYENKLLKTGEVERTFQFWVPQNAPGGDAVFAWTWFTVTGFREMYMNCAHVQISQPNPKITARKLNPARYPPMFVGEINQCKTREWFNLEFPQPGWKPFYGNKNDTPFTLSKPTGRC